MYASECSAAIVSKGPRPRDNSYGKMNVLWVCGVLRLDENDSVSSNEEGSEDGAEAGEFDAWPSEEGKEKTAHAKSLANKYTEICGFGGDLGHGWWEYDSDESSELRFDNDSNSESDQMESEEGEH